MGKILILPNLSTDTEADLHNGEIMSLHLNYMSDYSVLALRVDEIEAARTLIAGAGFEFDNTPAAIKVNVDKFTRMQDILVMFENHGIAATFTDIAVHFYQG